ncbi:MAG TPA: hypothetical protein VIQ00_02685 [Chitinophagaceae bacterium]
MPSTHSNNFHYLIEIAVNLNKSFEQEKRLSTPKTRKDTAFWKEKLKEWVKVNYENAGIVKNLN